MQEDRDSRRALDDLADLFLSDAPVKGEGTQSEASEPTDAGQVAELAAGPPPASGAEVIADELVGPEPMRLAPKVPPAAVFAAHARPTAADPEVADEARDRVDPIDAAVRGAIERRQGAAATPWPGAESAGASQAGAAEADRPQAGARPALLHAEAVLMGNLPGLSGPWLTQYAQLLAQHLGPVVMLHVDDERIDAELIEPTDRPQIAGRVPPGGLASDAEDGAVGGTDSAQAMARGSGRADLIARLESLMQPGSSQVRAVVVHGEASARPEALERLKALEHWTLLCGADDMAISAGQRLVESLAEADEAAARQRWGVMVVGSEAAAGRAAAQKLAAATRSLLDEPVRLVGTQRRMVPVNLRQLGRFGPTAELWPRLTAWLGQFDAAPPTGPLTIDERESQMSPSDLEAIEAAESGEVNGAASSAAGQPEVGLGETTDADWAWLRDAGTPAADAGQGQSGPEQANTGQAGTARSHAEIEDAGGTPTPSSGSEAKDASEGDELDLTQFLTTGDGRIAGGIALEARCPDQPRTQLLLDQRGRLHLLRRHTSESSGGEAPESLRSAVVDLLEARKWVLQHLDLLALTQRQCRFDTAAEPTLHLFTDRADLATGLIARLGDTLRVHLLKQVRVGAQSTWFCTPMQGEEG